MRSWIPALWALMLLLGLAACDESQDTQKSDTSAIPNAPGAACLRDIPEPSVVSDVPARVALTFEEFSYSFEEGRHRFTHNRRFKETAGIGLYIYRGKVCVEDAKSCADACVRYRIEPSGSLTQREHHFATPIDPDRITLQYWARDDAGNLFDLTREVRTSGQTATVVSE